MPLALEVHYVDMWRSLSKWFSSWRHQCNLPIWAEQMPIRNEKRCSACDYWQLISHLPIFPISTIRMLAIFGLACSILLVRAPVTVFFVVVVNQLWQQRRHHSSASLVLECTEWSGYHVTGRVRIGHYGSLARRGVEVLILATTNEQRLRSCFPNNEDKLRAELLYIGLNREWLRRLSCPAALF